MLKGIIPVAVSAELINKADGCPVFVSGRLLARLMLGKDNEGLIARREYLQYFSTVAIETDANLIADAQSGFGNEMSAWTAANELASAGAKYLMINDQIWPSNSKKVSGIVSEEDLLNRVKAAKDGGNELKLEVIPKLEGINRYGYEGLVYRIQILLKMGVKQIVVSRIKLDDLEKLSHEKFFKNLGFELDDKNISLGDIKKVNSQFIIPVYQVMEIITKSDKQVLSLKGIL